MRRLCERPGCSQPAEVAYRIEPDQLSVWLARADAVDGEETNVLCRRHADAMVVPLGWSLDDQREPVPRLFRPADPVAVVASVRPPARRQPAGRPDSRDEPTQLELGDEQPTAVADDLTTETALEAAWQPVFDQSDDLGGLLHAATPLLARAFGGAPRPPKKP